MKNNAGYCPQKPNFSEENFALLAHSQRRSKLGLGGPNARQQQPEVKSPLENVETGNKLIRYCCLFQCHSLLLYNNKRCFKIDLFKKYLINLFFFFSFFPGIVVFCKLQSNAFKRLLISLLAVVQGFFFLWIDLSKYYIISLFLSRHSRLSQASERYFHKTPNIPPVMFEL